jgi:P2 family phage contractile tail tube protein
MGIPSVLKNFNVFINGRGYAGLCDEAELPEIKFKMEEQRAGGMDVPFEIEMGQEVMSAKLTFATYPTEIIRALNSDARIQLRGALVNDATRATTAVLVEIGGRPKGFMPGSWKSGEKATGEFELAVDYYRWNQGGADLFEIDSVNMIRRIAGVDQLAEQRAALGL